MILNLPMHVKPPVLAAGITTLSAVEAAQFGTTLRHLSRSGMRLGGDLPALIDALDELRSGDWPTAVIARRLRLPVAFVAAYGAA
jgi:hypothetical protein